MPEIDPAYYDAIDAVVESRKENADWEEDEMRSALMDVARGESQTSAAENRSFTQPILSKRWANVEEKKDEIIERREQGSSLFRDPLQEMIDQFRDFFEEMNQKYDMGIHKRAIQMMVDEIEDAQQLPAPIYVEKFLRGTSSGVTGADVDYIQRRYAQWLESLQRDRQSEGTLPGGPSSFGGPGVQQQGQEPPNMGGGVPIGGAITPFGGPGMGQQQQGQQPQPQEPPRDPRVDEMKEEFEEIKAYLAEQAQDDSDEQSVTIEQEDGTKVTMPLQQAMAMGYLDGNDDDDDFLEQLSKARQAGLIPDPNADAGDDEDSLIEAVEKLRTLGLIDDGSDEQMADAIGEAIKSLGEKQMQAQQQMSQNFSNVLSQIQNMQEDDDEDLSAEDVQEIIRNELKEDEVDRLERQIESMRDDFVSKLERSRRPDGVVSDDPDYLKTDREMEFRERQLEAINENLRELPKEVSVAVSEGLVPAVKQLQTQPPGSGNPLWQPPQAQQQGRPGYVPDNRSLQTGVRENQAPAAEPAEPPADEGYPEPQPEPESEAEPVADDGADEETVDEMEERGRHLREKLNLDADEEAEAVEA